MIKSILALLTILISFLQAEAQYSRHIVKFRNKGGTPHSLSNPSAFLTQRAIDRRTRYSLSVDSTDLPISPAYLDSIRNTPNVTILNSSKWLNQVAIQTTDAAALAKIRSFPFVVNVTVIAPRLGRLIHKPQPEIFPSTQRTGNNQRSHIQYGQSFGQINIHRGQTLHDKGFQGDGMIVAILDGGYQGYKNNPAFDSARLNNQFLGEWDFVQNDSETDESSAHGMYCLSTMLANRPGIMVGSAPRARFYVYKTEDVYSEYPVEEHFWAAAAERADSLGADLISSSLGYQDFDDPSFDHLYPERNGNTAMVTIAADLAARKGMIVVNSAGNYGSLPDQRKYISCPADGDSVLAVGATNGSGQIASFSSWGPSSSGKIKPNVVSVGQGTVIASFNGNPVTGNGTSFSAPNMAGLLTCLWQAFPEFNNMTIIDAVQRSAHKFSNPDDRYGYGIPDMYKAYYDLKGKRSQNLIGGSTWFKAGPNPFSDSITTEFIADDDGLVKIYLSDYNGSLIDSASFQADSLDYRKHVFRNLNNLPAGLYITRYRSTQKDSSIVLSKGSNLFGNDWIKAFPNPFSNQLMVYITAPATGRASLTLYDAIGRMMQAPVEFNTQQGNVFFHEFRNLQRLGPGVFILRFEDGKNKRSILLFKNGQ